MLTRRIILTSLAALSLSPALHAEADEQFNIDSNGDRLRVTRHPAGIAGKRPGVILLHGARGIEIKPRAYERYAAALSANGIDVYVLRYLNAADTAAMSGTKASRESHETARFDGWSDAVSATVTAILVRPDSSGRIGLLGFSLGGYVAANTAARDARVAALAVLYAGMPDATIAKVKRLPPLIELHGDADRNVPIAKGRQLVALGKSLGADAELVSYPGKAHGFDFSDSDPIAAEAIDRVCRFFETRLAG